MQFKGQPLPDGSGVGLRVNLDVAEHTSPSSRMVAGEPLPFVADDTIAFAYSGVPVIECVSRKSRKGSGLALMLDRIWNGPDRADQAIMVDDMPDEEHALPEPADEEWPDRPSGGSNILVRDDFLGSAREARLRRSRPVSARTKSHR